MPFKCFNYDKIGHFSSKCSYKQKRQTSDDEGKYIVNIHNKEAKYKRKRFCVNDVDSSEETDIDSSCEDELNNFMLMAIEDFRNEYTGSDLNDEEARRKVNFCNIEQDIQQVNKNFIKLIE